MTTLQVEIKIVSRWDVVVDAKGPKLRGGL